MGAINKPLLHVTWGKDIGDSEVIKRLQFFSGQLFISLLILGCFYSKADFIELPKTSGVNKSVWKISNDSLSSGTVFFIGPKLFVTNFHVMSSQLAPGYDCYVELQSDEQPESSNEKCIKRNDIEHITLSQEGNHSVLKVNRILALSAFYDLALVETDNPVSDYLILSESPLKPEEEFLIQGYPNGYFKEMKKTGSILFSGSDLDYSFPVNYTPFMAMRFQGASGAPVLNKQGEVVAVIYSAVVNILSAVALNHLKEFITGETGLDCTDFVNAEECIRREIESLKELAETNSPVAQFKLSVMYSEGEWLEEDPEKAFELYVKAANQGYAVAQHNLGGMISMGTEKGFKKIERDFQKAFEWYTKAADQGYAPSQYDLGDMYRRAEGVEKDLQKAVGWLTQSANQGYAPAQYDLGDMYRRAEGVKKDLQKAIGWLTQSANQGYAPAQYVLGEMYAEGEGVEKDSQKSLKWIIKAKDQGYLLAFIYLDARQN